MNASPLPFRSLRQNLCGIACFAVATFFSGSLLTAQVVREPEIENRTRYVLLSNDRVLSGRVSQRGSSVIVRRGSEAELTLRVEQVRTVADSMPELYEARSRMLHRSNLQPLSDTLTDARWCIDQGLPAQATQLLMRVYAISPEHPVAVQLESRLRRSLTPNAAQPTSVVPEPMPATIQTVNHSVETAAEESQRDATAPRETRGEETSEDESSPQNLNALTAPASLHAFTAKVQPILISRCAKCHHDQAAVATNWNLVLPPGGSLRVTQRGSIANLEATLRLCDGSDPAQSELIAKALHDHVGNSTPTGSLDPGRQPPIREHETVLQRTLLDWIAAVATGSASASKKRTSSFEQAPAEERKRAAWPAPGMPFPIDEQQRAEQQRAEQQRGEQQRDQQRGGGKGGPIGEASGRDAFQAEALNRIEPSDVAASLQRPPTGVTQAASSTSRAISRAISTRPTRLPLIENPNDPQYFNRETLLMRELGLLGSENRP